MADYKIIQVKVKVKIDADAEVDHVISEMDYNFSHEAIIDTEIVDYKSSEDYF
jgi:hypothetical protein